MVRRFTLAAACAAVLLAPAASRAECAPLAPVCPTSAPSPSSSPTPQAGPNTAQMERQFVDLLNQERARRGLRRLSVDAELTSVARRHSRRMADSGRLYHNTSELGSADFARRTGYPSEIGENVGEGPTVRWLHDAFMDSPGHRSNILDRGYSRVGIGVVVRDDTVWVTQDFVGGVAGARSGAVRTAKVAAPPAPPAAQPAAAPAVSAPVSIGRILAPRAVRPSISALKLPPIPAPLPEPAGDGPRPLIPLAALATLSAVAFASRRDAAAWI